MNDAGPELFRVISYFSTVSFPIKSPSPSPLTSDALFRVVVLLTGRDQKLLGQPHMGSSVSRTEGFSQIEDEIYKRGRDHLDRAELLFRSLADPKADGALAYSVEEHKLLMDVLTAIQPRWSQTMRELAWDELKPMAERLDPKLFELENLRISVHKLQLFMQSLGVDEDDWLGAQSFSEGVTFAMFREIYSSEVDCSTEAHRRSR